MYKLRTETPIASWSHDHLFPRGTKNDDTHCFAFIDRCEELFPGRPLSYLDLGCAGGGLVLDFSLRGHNSFGLEGSDYSKREGRASWGLIPERLATCDITEPFFIHNGVTMATFDIISAWEVLEHIPETRLEQLWTNIRRHLDCIFIASVAMFPDEDSSVGARWHNTIRPYEWWLEEIKRNGLRVIASPFKLHECARHEEPGFIIAAINEEIL